MSKKTVIKATLRIRLKPWAAPNYARREGVDESSEISPIAVIDLDDDALKDMALAWLEDLYEKAGRRYCPYQKRPKDASGQ